MELKQLEFFISVAELGNMTKAAQQHYVSQRCLYLIQSNDSRDFEHPRVHFNRCCTDWLSS